MTRVGSCSAAPRWWAIARFESRSSLMSKMSSALGCMMARLSGQVSEAGIVAAFAVQLDSAAMDVALACGVHTGVDCPDDAGLVDAEQVVGMGGCWEMNEVLAATCRLPAAPDLGLVPRMMRVSAMGHHSTADGLLVSYALPDVWVDRSQSEMVPWEGAACVGQIPLLRAALLAVRVEEVAVVQAQVSAQND